MRKKKLKEALSEAYGLIDDMYGYLFLNWGMDESQLKSDAFKFLEEWEEFVCK